MKLFFIVTDHGLMPHDEKTAKYMSNRTAGQIISAEIKQARNYLFHEKMFSLFRCVHNNLPAPEPIWFRGELITPEHNIDSTREYLVVKAGHYTVKGYPNGSVRVEAKSLSYENMDAETFEKVYSDVITAALRILPKEWSDAEIERVANEILSYA